MIDIAKNFGTFALMFALLAFVVWVKLLPYIETQRAQYVTDMKAQYIQYVADMKTQNLQYVNSLLTAISDGRAEREEMRKSREVERDKFLEERNAERTQFLTAHNQFLLAHGQFLTALERSCRYPVNGVKQ